MVTAIQVGALSRSKGAVAPFPAARARPWPGGCRPTRPAAHAKPSLPSARHARTGRQEQGGGSGPAILVVDDEPLIRELLQLTLEQQGFSVFLAADGREALALYQAQRSTIALVLLDVRMPGLDGPATLTALRRLDPAICACFLTGHAGGYTDEELLERGAVRVFAKPFHSAELGVVLRQVIVQHECCGD